MAIRIITDSTSDVTLQQAEELGVYLASLTVSIDGTEYIDGDTITHDNFYDLSDVAKNPVLTSQPSPETFMNLYNKAKEAGDKVIGIFVSQHLSGTYQSACIARDSVDYDDIYLIDTNNISVSVKLMVFTALKLIKEGLGYQELCSKLDEYRDRLDAYAIIGDLKYLKRSGRLSPTTTFVANLLQMKPITTLQGKVEVVAKSRGMSAAIKKAIDIIKATYGLDNNEMVVVGYTGRDNQWQKEFVIELEDNFSIGKNMKMSAIGASVGNHVGAGSIAIGFFRNK